MQTHDLFDTKKTRIIVVTDFTQHYTAYMYNLYMTYMYKGIICIYYVFI